MGENSVTIEYNTRLLIERENQLSKQLPKDNI